MSRTLATMKTRVGLKFQKTDATYANKIEDFIQSRYQVVLSRYRWPELFRTKSVSSIAGENTLVLGKDIAGILAIQDRTNDIVFTPIGSPSAGARRFVASQDVSGTPYDAWKVEDTVADQPSSASVLAIVSSSGSDTTEKVRVVGLNGSGERVTETVTLNGISAQSTTNSYATVERISKDGNTVGTITITSNSGAITVATIAPTEVSPVYTKIQFSKTPSETISYTVDYIIKAPELINAEDVPFVPCEEAIECGAYADCLYEDKQFEKAALQEARFESLIEDMVARIEIHSEHIPQAIPHVEVIADDRPF